MKFFLRLILIAIVSALLQLYFPWWIIMIVSFVSAILVFSSRSSAFFSGFLAIFLLWGIYAFIINSGNNSVLSSKMAPVLFMPSGFLLIMVTGIIGGLAAGFAALSGQLFREIFTKKKRLYY